MNKISAIMSDYTSGIIGVEEANTRLMDAEAGFHLDLTQNLLTPDEIINTTVSDDPTKVRGAALLDTGTGGLNKVSVDGGKLAYPVNEVQPDGSTNMPAFVYIGGRHYEVKGDALTVKEVE